ncbi:hypothetical protein F5B19DRAFT_421284 [Rostrohypoxylon terebratum]|nr:hypothetical protein F5B19DRAFT_421284 [Rostrohypoxylon terebratum]
MSVSIPPGTTTTVKGPVTDYDDLVPLLTTFTPSPSCEDDWVYDTQTEGLVWKDRAYNEDYAEWCQPFFGANQFYRPGICPSGQEFKSLDVTVEDNSGTPGASWYFGLCCSSNYELSFSEGYTILPACFGGVVPPVTANVRDTTTTDDESPPPLTTISSTVTGVMQAINIIWKEEDLTYFSAPVANSFRALMGLSPLPTTTVSGSTGSAALPATQSASDGFDQDGDGTGMLSNSLSDGAKAGIGIGAIAFVALLVSIFYLGFVRRRRRSKDRRGSGTIANTDSSEDDLPRRRSRLSWLLPWRGKRTMSVEKAPGELHGQDTHEIDGRPGYVAELQDTQMGGWKSPVAMAQWHTELQGSTLAAQSQTPAELESQPLKNESPL